MTWLERFWSYVDTSGDCWLWTGAKKRHGYGVYGTRRVSVLAHRFSWEFANRTPIPAGLHVLHRCDNPPCVNPAHLSVGTPGDNVADAIAKGRLIPFSGARAEATRRRKAIAAVLNSDTRLGALRAAVGVAS